MLKIVWLILGISAISFGSRHCRNPDAQNENPLVDSEILEWRLVDATPPSPRLEADLVHDPERNTFVAFGGRDENWDAVNETWQFDPAAGTWSRIETAGSPGPRFMHRMVYDSRRGRMVLFGGTDGTGSVGDLWVFELDSMTWVEVGIPPPTSRSRDDNARWPVARQLHGMTYDSHNDRLIVFGGRYEGGGSVRTLGDTWIFDFEDGMWIEMTPESSPSVRDHATMVYDAQRRVAVLFGGSGATGTLADTWVYDVQANRWTSMEPAGAPSPRDHHFLAYDPNAGSVLLVGGSFEDDRIFRYLHDDGRWVAVEPVGDLPSMADHMLGTMGEGRFVLMGGFRGGPSLQAQTWVLSTR